MYSRNDQKRLMYRIAKEYYFTGKTQNNIGKQFGLSRIKVSRLLKHARKTGIINITITAPPGYLGELESGLEERFGLKEAVVVPIDDEHDIVGLTSEISAAGAECVMRRISGDEVIGISWGSTMHMLINLMPARTLPKVTVVQMNGGIGPQASSEHSTEIARRMAEKLNARFKLLPAPGSVADHKIAKIMMRDTLIAEALDVAAHADIAIVGIGILDQESLLMRIGSILSQKEFEQLKAAGAIADIALRYIDKAGEPVTLDIQNRVIGLTFKQLKSIPTVIAVAGGPKKFKAIRAALQSGIPTVLVTDQFTARRLLND